ncbi:MAG: RHS repeat-associated core domain-containing protein [Saprospiraceae bacterium]
MSLRNPDIYHRAYTQALLDNMTYCYAAGTNKISSISDAASATQGGFRAASGGMTYACPDRMKMSIGDVNACPPLLFIIDKWRGSMVSNAAKGITSITYNHLNLPTNITITGGKTIDFTYTASGTKLRKVVKTGATINLVQEYINGIEYRGTAIPASTIEAIYHAEGRLYYTGSAWQREFTIKDHLGDTRITYADINGDGVVATPSEILQENNYDPRLTLCMQIIVVGQAFGYTNDGVWMNHVNNDNLYQYNGKELNNDHGIGMMDYGARWYDGGIGRWTQVDPMAENRSWVSTYNYVQNNPILRNDPTGALDQVGDPVQPSVAGILLEGAYQAISAGFNYIMRAGEALGLGTEGRSTRASVRHSEGGGVEGIDIVNGPSLGFVAETKSAIGDALALTPLKGGAAVLAAETGVKNEAVNVLKSSGAARREAMREAGIPTSQQPISQSRNASGREYTYSSAKKGGGTEIKSVQQQTMDASHPGQNHWEAGKVRTDADGNIKMNNYGRPRLDNDKSKINY